MNTHAAKLTTPAVFAAVLIIGLTAQEFGPRGRQQESKLPPTYTVGGVRDGISYFRRVAETFTKLKAAGEIDFLHYHTNEEVNAILRRWAADYPNIM